MSGHPLDIGPPDGPPSWWDDEPPTEAATAAQQEATRRAFRAARIARETARGVPDYPDQGFAAAMDEKGADQYEREQHEMEGN